MDKVKKIKTKYKYLKKTINYIHDISGKLRNIILLDIIWCCVRYGTTSNEYRIFEYYKIKNDKRKTYLNTFKHNFYNKHLYDKIILNVLNDKELFRLRFKDYFKREVIDVNDLSFKEYEELCIKNKILICRNGKQSYLKSFKIYNLNNYRSPAYMIDEIKKDKKILVEKSIKMHKLLNDINNELVIINVTTLFNNDSVEVISSSVKYKDYNEVISGFIDIKSGKVKGHLKDENGLNYKTEIMEFEIPKYKEIIKLSKKLAKELEGIKEVEWSFTVNNRGTVYLLDANIYDDFIFEQTPEFLNNKVGLLPIYKKVIKKIRGF